MAGLKPVLAGVDYGAQRAGTTVLAWLDAGGLQVVQSRKGESADTFLAAHLRRICPAILAIDAPLSLPAVYRGQGTDYHYRRCDRLTGAMSPMFLGGLTARALALRAQLSDLPAVWYETYPSLLARWRFDLDHRDEEGVGAALAGLWPEWPLPEVANQHVRDALLALAGAWFVQQRRACFFGAPSEGVIMV